MNKDDNPHNTDLSIKQSLINKSASKSSFGNNQILYPTDSSQIPQEICWRLANVCSQLVMEELASFMVDDVEVYKLCMYGDFLIEQCISIYPRKIAQTIRVLVAEHNNSLNNTVAGGDQILDFDKVLSFLQQKGVMSILTPCCVSINETLSHYSPAPVLDENGYHQPSDSEIIKAGDVVRVHFSAAVLGCESKIGTTFIIPEVGSQSSYTEHNSMFGKRLGYITNEEAQLIIKKTKNLVNEIENYLITCYYTIANAATTNEEQTNGKNPQSKGEKLRKEKDSNDEIHMREIISYIKKKNTSDVEVKRKEKVSLMYQESKVRGTIANGYAGCFVIYKMLTKLIKPEMEYSSIKKLIKDVSEYFCCDQLDTAVISEVTRWRKKDKYYPLKGNIKVNGAVQSGSQIVIDLVMLTPKVAPQNPVKRSKFTSNNLLQDSKEPSLFCIDLMDNYMSSDQEHTKENTIELDKKDQSSHTKNIAEQANIALEQHTSNNDNDDINANGNTAKSTSNNHIISTLILGKKKKKVIPKSFLIKKSMDPSMNIGPLHPTLRSKLGAVLSKMKLCHFSTRQFYQACGNDLSTISLFRTFLRECGIDGDILPIDKTKFFKAIIIPSIGKNMYCAQITMTVYVKDSTEQEINSSQTSSNETTGKFTAIPIPNVIFCKVKPKEEWLKIISD